MIPPRKHAVMVHGGRLIATGSFGWDGALTEVYFSPGRAVSDAEDAEARRLLMEWSAGQHWPSGDQINAHVEAHARG